MHKIYWQTPALVAAMTLSALTVPTASAAALNEMAQCQLVPFARYSATEDTTVGLITDTAGTVYWQFYDQDGTRQDSGLFDMSDNAFQGFSLSNNVTVDLSNQLGFLLFCLDDNRNGRVNENDSPDLTANALWVRSGGDDVAFIPTVPVQAEDLNDDDATTDIADWTDDPLDELSGSATPDERLLMRYFTDGVAGSGDGTTIYLFTTRSPNGSENVTAVGPGLTSSVDIPLGKVRLNAFDAESVAALNEEGLIGSGFLSWDIPSDIRSAFAFSIVESQAFSATQTLVGGLDK